MKILKLTLLLTLLVSIAAFTAASTPAAGIERPQRDVERLGGVPLG